MQCDYIEGPPRPPRIAKNSHFFTGYNKYVCSVIRFYCPPYCRFKLKKLLIMYIDMGQRIHWKQYGLIVTIAGAPGLGLHGQNVIAKKILFSHCDNL